MNQAKKIKTTDWEYANKSIGNKLSKDLQLENSVPCPRYVQEVYSLGASLQYYVGDKYLSLAVLNRGAQKSQYETLAMSQLDYKEAIQKVANMYLNEMLVYFYNNGGPVMEAPVSESLAKAIQPFFNRIFITFMNQLDLFFTMAAEGKMNTSELVTEIDNCIIGMYTALSKLYQVEEINCAFEQLISIKNNKL